MNKNQLLKELQSLSDRLSHLENDKKAAQNFDKMKERLEHGMPLYEDEKTAFNEKKQADELDFINDALEFARENPHLAARTVPHK